MTPFDFNQQLDGSREPVKRVVQYLEGRSDIEWARDVQSESAYHYQGDIQLQKAGQQPEFMEVKVESRTSSQTPNLAIERYSDTVRQTDGGPWKTKADYYTHFYSDGLLVIMLRIHLLKWLNENYVRFRAFEAANAGWVTTGILVRREDAKRGLGKAYYECRIAA